MSLGFSEWLEKQEMKDEAKDLFIESIKCYKTSAYRAALLFSFLGFQTVIKHRLLQSKPPEKYQISEWGQIHKKLQNDDSWEKNVIEAIKDKKKPIFKLSEDIYEQYFYWKNRRNDCAHAKGNTISYPHVESFWLFIESNLSKFVVNGGSELIIQQITDYLNPSITPAGTDIKPIISQIPFAVELIDYKELLEKLLKLTNENKLPYTRTIPTPLASIWAEMFTLPEERTNILIDFLINIPKFTFFLLRANPNTVKHFYNKNEFIRTFWKEDFSISGDYHIFINMIR
ncbi:hypothetical protein, partial [Peribacillus frigoritolerans]|uniref:hypothetical protein n=1 Tax=Peribacillus frigoritolerans TaxID=450367 RepID=UPI002416AF8D